MVFLFVMDGCDGVCMSWVCDGVVMLRYLMFVVFEEDVMWEMFMV